MKSALEKAIEEKRLHCFEEGEIFSNLDGVIDEGLAARLKTEAIYAGHSAWEFKGYIWFADGQFHEEVWRDNEPVALVHGDSVEAVVQQVCDKYGSA